MKASLVAVAGVALATFLACEGDNLDVGKTANTEDAGALVGPRTFTGYLEAFELASGSDRITLALTIAADGAVEGTVTFGDGPLLEPPSDPDVGYPPSLSVVGQVILAQVDQGPGREACRLFTPVGTEGLCHPFEHFAYTVKGSLVGSRIRLTARRQELWKQWCELQTPYPIYRDGEDHGALLGHRCRPFDGNGQEKSCAMVDPTTQQRTPVDCVKLALCRGQHPEEEQHACFCTATGCTVDPSAPSDLTFDMQLAGDHLDGRAAVATAHLTRVPDGP